jgi:signal transduction histidine kinase
MNLRRLFLYLLIASVTLSAVIGIGVILFGDFGLIEVRVLMTTLTVTAASVFGLSCGAYLESGRGKYVPWAGIALSIASALMCFFIIWNVLDESEIFIKSFVTVTLLAAACSYLSLLSLARLERRFGWPRTAATICVTLLSIILLYILWFEPEGESTLIYRILGVLGILLASITVVTPVLLKLSSVSGDADEIGELDKAIEDLERRLEQLRSERERLAAKVTASTE